MIRGSVKARIQEDYAFFVIVDLTEEALNISSTEASRHGAAKSILITCHAIAHDHG